MWPLSFLIRPSEVAEIIRVESRFDSHYIFPLDLYEHVFSLNIISLLLYNIVAVIVQKNLYAACLAF